MSDDHDENGQFAEGNEYRFRDGNKAASKFSWDTLDKILESISEGSSLLVSCASAGVSRSTFYNWMYDDEIGTRVLDMYTRAREERADLLADEVISIADGADAEKDNPQLIKQRIDARKWAAGKMAPRIYGDRVHTEVSGPGGGPIKSETKSNVDLSGLTDDQLEQLEGLVTTAAEVITKRGSDSDGEEEEMGEESA